MRLIRFLPDGQSDPLFGAVIADRAVALTVLAQKASKPATGLTDSRSYLTGLPETEHRASELVAWAHENTIDEHPDESYPLDEVQLRVPVEVSALYDFGLTPRHLQNSARTMTEYERPYPETTALLDAFARSIASSGVGDEPDSFSYYKCNMNSIAGNDVVVPWPAYTSRLDIEPELAVVYGNPRQPIAGFCIFNDVSARDVQAPEFIGGFCLAKDMAQGNQLGPCLVSPDEIGNPYDLTVEVAVNGQPRFRGNTSEISHDAASIIAYLESIAPLHPGSVLGFGTIPDCTGLDLDDFLSPGDAIEITFDRLGTLRCQFDVPGHLLPSRWPARPELETYVRT